LKSYIHQIRNSPELGWAAYVREIAFLYVLITWMMSDSRI